MFPCSPLAATSQVFIQTWYCGSSWGRTSEAMSSIAGSRPPLLWPLGAILPIPNPGIDPGSPRWKLGILTIWTNWDVSDVRVELTSPASKSRCFTLKLTRLFSRWGSNPRPSAHKTDALPTELHEMIPAVGFEPTKYYTTHLECAPFDLTWVYWFSVLPKSIILKSITNIIACY